MTVTNSLRGLAAGAALVACAAPLAAQHPAHHAPAGSTGDPVVRPQDDFYRAVNGEWFARTVIPGDKASYGSFTELRDRSDAALRAIIEEAAAATSAPAGSDAQKIGDYYRAYMDTARIEALGLAPLRAELDRVAALRDRRELPALLAQLQRIGVRGPVALYVGQDAKDATRYVANLSQSGLGLPDRDYYLKAGEKFDAQRAAYATYVETLLREAGHADPAAAAKDVIALERQLAEAQWERAKLRNPEARYNPHTLAQLDTLAPRLGLAALVREAGAEKTPTVIVGQPDYVRALDGVVAATPVATLRDYLTVRLLDAYAGVLPARIADASFDFRGRALQGLEQQRPRWQRGVGAVEGAMGELVGKQYVERHFRPEDKARMQQLVDNLLAAFRQGIDSLAWMSPETRAQARAKLDNFTVKIGYPDEWQNYDALVVRAGDVAGNVRRSNEFDYAEMVERLGRPIDRKEWGMTPQTVNAYYSPSMNEIVFPAAILQPPFFDPNADDATNYGAIGGVIGHEISHGFDDQGSQYAGDGNLRNWWTESDRSAFSERADALVAQYGALSPVEGLNVNGRLTLGENIGDLSGLTVAYRAYQLAKAGQPDTVINGLTGDQRFFTGWARIWRSLDRDDALRQRVLTDPHSPNEYRTNQVLRNMPEFLAAFGVQPGDGMWLAPEQRVKIW